MPGLSVIRDFPKPSTFSAKGKGAGKKRRSRSIEIEGRGGWMSLYTKAGKLTVYPKLTSLKH